MERGTHCRTRHLPKDEAFLDGAADQLGLPNVAVQDVRRPDVLPLDVDEEPLLPFLGRRPGIHKRALEDQLERGLEQLGDPTPRRLLLPAPAKGIPGLGPKVPERVRERRGVEPPHHHRPHAASPSSAPSTSSAAAAMRAHFQEPRLFDRVGLAHRVAVLVQLVLLVAAGRAIGVRGGGRRPGRPATSSSTSRLEVQADGGLHVPGRHLQVALRHGRIRRLPNHCQEGLHRGGVDGHDGGCDEGAAAAAAEGRVGSCAGVGASALVRRLVRRLGAAAPGRVVDLWW